MTRPWAGFLDICWHHGHYYDVLSASIQYFREDQVMHDSWPLFQYLPSVTMICGFLSSAPRFFKFLNILKSTFWNFWGILNMLKISELWNKQLFHLWNNHYHDVEFIMCTAPLNGLCLELSVKRTNFSMHSNCPSGQVGLVLSLERQ